MHSSKSPRKKVDKKKLEGISKELLETLGCDLEDENLIDSPRRIAQAWIDLTKGMDQVGQDKLETTFKKACRKAGECRDMITLSGRFHSLCAHHLLPFRGFYVLSYIPKELIIGASKPQRIVDFHADRLQSQEHLAHDVLETFCKIVVPVGAAVWFGGMHDCMGLRGVTAHDAFMENQHFQGSFNNDHHLQQLFSDIVSRKNMITRV